MKILTIYIDMRKSKELTIDEKREKYRLLYSEFSSYDPILDNIARRTDENGFIKVGDGIIMNFNCDDINSAEKDFITLIKEINDKAINLENKIRRFIGVGISYSIADGDGQNLFSPSIDGADIGAKLGMKYIIKDTRWRWVLPLVAGDDNEGSLQDVKDIIEDDISFEKHTSSSKKNFWFNVL